MNRLAVFLVLLLTSFIGPASNEGETVIIDRIAYIYKLKTLIDKHIWRGFADDKFDLPLVYYTDTVCYVANPTKTFLEAFKTRFVARQQNVSIYKAPLLDSAPFHMATGMTFGDSSSSYSYKSPFMNCSSFEITRNIVPDVNSTEEWTTMILHEYFHGFQFKHTEFVRYFEKNITTISEDSLKKIYQAQTWFKKSVDKENELLLRALKEADQKNVKNLLRSFFSLRSQRRLETKKRLSVDIERTEQVYETMEGTARFVEFGLYTIFANKEPDRQLMKSDSCYHVYKDFRNYRMENDKWLYLSERTSYFYATGFNIVRLLEKLDVNYNTRLFNDGQLSLETLLREYHQRALKQ
jgi:hypothetical protein